MERESEAFLRRYRLGRNKNYRLVYRRGKSTPSRDVVLIHMKGRDLKIGFSVSSKVGNAVTRNRLRRWMREDIRRIRPRMKCGRYIFVARPSMKDMEHAALTAELLRVLERAKLLREESHEKHS
jgi:ribonuclease P protein component, eubacterial